MGKRLLLLASASIFTFSIFIITTLGVLSVLIRPNYLKQWGTKSGAYQKLPEIVINQSASDREDQEGVSLSNDLVRQAAESTLTPAFFQRSGEQIIDGSFSWLDGHANHPTFNIDLLAVKQQFADNLGSYLKKRYEELPACPPGTAPESTDLFTIDCRPSNEILDIDEVIDGQKLALLEEESFLGAEEISYQSFGGEDGGQKNPLQSSAIPTGYSWFRRLPIIFGALALISGVGVVFLCQDKRFGVRKLGWRMVAAGILAILTTFAGLLGVISLTKLIANQPSESMVAPFAPVITAIVNTARADVLVYSLAAAFTVLAIGIILLVITRGLSRRSQAKEQSEYTPPPPPQPANTNNQTLIQPPNSTPVATTTPTPAPTPSPRPTPQSTTPNPMPSSAPPVPEPRPPKPPLIQ